jgi:hypothetical protein
MKLRKHDLCPIHRSRSCCGRPKPAAPAVGSFGIRRMEDPRHPRGYREYRSPAEMRRLAKLKIAEQQNRCAICGREFKRFQDVVPDHIQPKGMGGAWRDDHPDNIQAVHRHCNLRKGSMRSPRTG